MIWKKKQKRIVVTVLKDRLGKTLTPKVSQLEMYGFFWANRLLDSSVAAAAEVWFRNG